MPAPKSFAAEASPKCAMGKEFSAVPAGAVMVSAEHGWRGCERVSIAAGADFFR